MSDLSDQALDMLINSGATSDHAGPGSLIGVGPEDAIQELIASGLVTERCRLTRAGARRANREKDLYFNRP